MCFMKKSWGEKSRGTVPLTSLISCACFFDPHSLTRLSSAPDHSNFTCLGPCPGAHQTKLGGGGGSMFCHMFQYTRDMYLEMTVVLFPHFFHTIQLKWVPFLHSIDKVLHCSNCNSNTCCSLHVKNKLHDNLYDCSYILEFSVATRTFSAFSTWPLSFGLTFDCCLTCFFDINSLSWPYNPAYKIFTGWLDSFSYYRKGTYFI